MTVTGAQAEPSRVAEARELLLGGDAPAAVRLLRAHLADEPSDARAWHRLAGALIGGDQPDEAVRAATRAVELAPDLAKAHHFLALAEHVRGDHRAALTAVVRALELDPTDAQSHALRADVLLARGADRSEVLLAHRAAAAIAPDHPAVRAVGARVRAAGAFPFVTTGFAAVTGPTIVLALVVQLVGLAPDGGPVLPLAAGGCALLSAGLLLPVRRARRRGEVRDGAGPALAASVLGAGTVAATLTAVGGAAGAVAGFAALTALLSASLALPGRRLAKG
ncbi:tetratricopeptide repeat protein [Micromonospora psammae]|uniref:tetratricopeptide repeat protein n=1 Tax=Micromonospora sp. CPCC 205556 TaxID=3122398 RepID=UPI002FF083EA